MGIAGTAMGALAGMLKDAGFHVTGSDRGVYPPMSDYLAGLGIQVMEGFNRENLAHQPDLVVVGNVVRAIYEEAQALLESDIAYCSFPELIRALFIQDAHSLVIAGTHGKTTTTAIASWLLTSIDEDPGFLIGGVAKNFDRTARKGLGPWFVIEGDEYDTAFFDKGPKFLHYKPNTVILTSIEFDHADIYTDLDHVKRSFEQLMTIIPEDGTVIARGDNPGVQDVLHYARCPVFLYGPGHTWDGTINDVNTETGTMTFTVHHQGKDVGTYQSLLTGTHNLYNQVASVAALHHMGISLPTLQAGFKSFLGIKRRQEILGTIQGVTVVDDFAHHPTAVDVTLHALKQRFGTRRLWAVWEPRSATSRRNTFQEAYASAFSAADKIIIARPFNQENIPEDERFSSDTLVEALSHQGLDATTTESTDEILSLIMEQREKGDVVAILSNGSFDGLHGRLLESLNIDPN
jgi:UDP-N-acetylmuramate: L-alanyl-gamma-D-glutamyl-meso-diaminopimelate ligase